MKKIIEYKGKSIYTNHFIDDLTDELFFQLRNEYYKKPDIEYVIQEMKNLHNGKIKTTNITNYFFKELMSKVLLYNSKWCIEDVFESKELLGYFIHKTMCNNKVYPKNNTLIKNIETSLRIGGKGIARKPSNFPLKTCLQIIDKYNINNNFFDFSCGWGVRLLSALIKNVNYYGTDPNYKLTEQLENMANLYKNTNNTNNIVEINTKGSEIFIPKYENKIGLAFSSPPYFKLEQYKIGNQSCNKDTNYADWKNNYLVPTFKNIHKYLIGNGKLLLNINNYSNFNLVEDSREIILQNGFSQIDSLYLKNIKRCNSKGELNDNSEIIMVFEKRKD